MATIKTILEIDTTVSTLDAPTIASIIAWVQTNVITKIPAGSTPVLEQYVVIR